MALHDAVRQARLAQGRTIADLASVAGVEGSHLSRFERGEREMSSGRLQRVLIALGLELQHATSQRTEPPAAA